jgi:putative autoinducer-2 (AI-2) aldolase
MDWGMKNRLSRIFRPETGRTLMLAIDHGYFLGPTSGLEKPYETVKDLLPYANSLMLTRGVLRSCIPPETDIPIVLRMSGGTSVLRELSEEGLAVAVEDAIRLNASAITLSIFVGEEGERETLLNLAELIDAGQEHGIPVLAVTAVGKNMNRDARYLGLACRISAELGAHMVKTYYCEGFEEIVRNTPVPIVIAGGKKQPERDALQMAYEAIQCGASGVDMGRNIFQSDSPVGMIQAVRSIVQENRSAEEAFEIYQETKAGSPAMEPQPA